MGCNVAPGGPDSGGVKPTSTSWRTPRDTRYDARTDLGMNAAVVLATALGIAGGFLAGHYLAARACQALMQTVFDNLEIEAEQIGTLLRAGHTRMTRIVPEHHGDDMPACESCLARAATLEITWPDGVTHRVCPACSVIGPRGSLS